MRDWGGYSVWAGGGVGWTRTLHQSHEQQTHVHAHCDADNTLFTLGRSQEVEVTSLFRQLQAEAGGTEGI